MGRFDENNATIPGSAIIKRNVFFLLINCSVMLDKVVTLLSHLKEFVPLIKKNLQLNKVNKTKFSIFHLPFYMVFYTELSTINLFGQFRDKLLVDVKSH